MRIIRSALEFTTWRCSRPRNQRSEKSAKRKNVGRKSLLWRRRRLATWRRNRWL